MVERDSLYRKISRYKGKGRRMKRVFRQIPKDEADKLSKNLFDAFTTFVDYLNYVIRDGRWDRRILATYYLALSEFCTKVIPGPIISDDLLKSSRFLADKILALVKTDKKDHVKGRQLAALVRDLILNGLLENNFNYYKELKDGNN